MRVLAIFALLLSQPAAAAGLEGTWYGQGYQPALREFMQWLTTRNADGSFVNDFRKYSDCHLVTRQVETGTWRETPGGWHEDVAVMNGRKAAGPVGEDYAIRTRNAARIQYQHLASGEVWVDEKVGADFQFPSCAPIS